MMRLAIDPDEMAQNYLISSKPKKRTCETNIWCKNLVFCSLVFSLFSSLHPYSNHKINQHRKQCGPWQLLLLILSDEHIPDLGITRAACVVHCTFFSGFVLCLPYSFAQSFWDIPLNNVTLDSIETYLASYQLHNLTYVSSEIRLKYKCCLYR